MLNNYTKVNTACIIYIDISCIMIELFWNLKKNQINEYMIED